MNRLDIVEKTQLKENIPAFQAGDTVKVHVRIKEGNKERLQVFEGVVIARKHAMRRADRIIREVYPPIVRQGQGCAHRLLVAAQNPRRCHSRRR